MAQANDLGITMHHNHLNFARGRNAFARGTRFRPGWAMHTLVLAWGALVAGGMGLVWQYQHDAGTLHAAPQHWPADSSLRPSPDRWTLVLFAHPKCPCTRATVGELARIIHHGGDRLQAHVLFVKPRSCAMQPDWEHTTLWDAAKRIPGVSVTADVGGDEAHRFRAATSGLVLLYDPAGNLKFRGGITASRGHSGDNLGRTTVARFLTHGSTDVDRTKVYGCELGIELEET
ncbi:RedB protein [Stieleria mannarensis]|uniref:RedB protein n=1 Tax=Stieleria mannarensis TaxID=2755585 RepID=UPI0016016BA4|nr:RedB protein [Rhodopirellula sp. JC639]